MAKAKPNPRHGDTEAALQQQALLRVLQRLTADEQSVSREAILEDDWLWPDDSSRPVRRAAGPDRLDREWTALDNLCRAGLATLRMSLRPVGDRLEAIESVQVTLRGRRDDRAIMAKIQASIPAAAKINRFHVDPEMFAALTPAGEKMKADVEHVPPELADEDSDETLMEMFRPGIHRQAQETVALLYIAPAIVENDSKPPVFDVQAVRSTSVPREAPPVVDIPNEEFSDAIHSPQEWADIFGWGKTEKGARIFKKQRKAEKIHVLAITSKKLRVHRDDLPPEHPESTKRKPTK
jgi:hypothetical protein